MMIPAVGSDYIVDLNLFLSILFVPVFPTAPFLSGWYHTHTYHFGLSSIYNMTEGMTDRLYNGCTFAPQQEHTRVVDLQLIVGRNACNKGTSCVCYSSCPLVIKVWKFSIDQDITLPSVNMWLGEEEQVVLTGSHTDIDVVYKTDAKGVGKRHVSRDGDRKDRSIYKQYQGSIFRWER
jgi:hypothetical protein